MDSLGISEPSKFEFHENFKKLIHFYYTPQQYVVALPWKLDHPPLQPNFKSCVSRLFKVRDRLVKLNIFEVYSMVLEEHLSKR